MPPSSSQTCNESASYFSEKCRECKFHCLKPDSGKSGKNSAVNIIGSVAVVAGAGASFVDQPVAASALTLFGAGSILFNIFHR